MHNIHKATLALAFLAAQSAFGYSVVQISTAAPAGTETQFINATEAQFNAQVIPNPFASNTYSIKLYGPNPGFNPLVTNAQLLNALTAVSTGTYVYGFANGMTYQQTMEEGLVGSFGLNCSSSTVFGVSTGTTFDAPTCQAIIGTIEQALYQQSLSTPTVIPGQP